MRERRGQEERDRERMEKERREESRNDTNTDIETTQSRQKKGQMKSIFLSDSDKEVIMEFVYSTRNFMTRPTTVSKTSRRRNDFGSSYQLPETCLSRLCRSGSRLNVPDMASSLR